MCLGIIFFFFNDTATTEIYTLSLHDALPIFELAPCVFELVHHAGVHCVPDLRPVEHERSEEHTSELQSRLHLVCRLLLEKKKTHSSRPDSVLTVHTTGHRFRISLRVCDAFLN